MTALRWLLGTSAAVVVVGWLVVAAMADGFRRSFGASVTGPLLVFGPPLVASLLLGVVFPVNRALLGAGLVAAVVLALGALAVLRESRLMGLTGLGYALAWLGYYFLRARGT